ncbi:MAG: DUF3244 domain-containing protein [Heliobacteriaceae bacterium]|jgi:hypothetical protein|nr:DUF3244 domain-containing protein [Heliobacteriaceae bacterium]
MKSIRKKLLLPAAVGIIFAAAVLNMRLNTQNENRGLSINRIEALSGEWWMDEDDEIDLLGSLVVMTVKSYSQPFQAIKHSSHINVYYSVNLTDINVKLVKASGQTVYSNTVNPIAGGQLYISLSGLSAGDYTIVFTAPNGNSIYGDFEI